MLNDDVLGSVSLGKSQLTFLWQSPNKQASPAWHSLSEWHSEKKSNGVIVIHWSGAVEVVKWLPWSGRES